MINGKLLVAIGVLFAAAVTVTSALAQAPMQQLDREIKLKEKAEVWSQALCLSDLVDDGWVQGRCAVERATCCHWSMAGERSRVFKRAELQKELSRLNFGGFSLVLRGRDEIAVTQTRRELTKNELQAKIVALASARLGDDGKGAGVAALKLRSPIYVAFEEESSWDVVLPEPLLEHAAVKVVSTADAGGVLGWVQVTLRLESDVYVARKMLRPNDLLKPEDFEIKRANILAAQSSGTAIFRKEQFPEGVRARQTIMAGTALSAALVERVPMVRLGDTVTLILRGDNLRISTKGVVQGTAAIGDMVTVQLSRYNRTFRGRLVEGRLVEVWL